MKRSPFFKATSKEQLFQKIIKEKELFQKKHPKAKLISLGIGDTTEPLIPEIAQSMATYAQKLSTKEGYSGYGDEPGNFELRQKIASTYYQDKFQKDEVFISDGAQTDIGRLQILLGPHASVAVENPAYPAYKDTTLLFRGFEKLIEIKGPGSNFDYRQAKRADAIFISSPHNPTGYVWSKQELETLVHFAKKENKLILFDAAYSLFIQQEYPTSIYEIEDGDQVAIEIGSFSKSAGFSGLRLGWTVVPKKLCYSNSTHSLNTDWNRLVASFYNGAPSIIQHAGITTLDKEVLQCIKKQAVTYVENASLLRSQCEKKGWHVFGEGGRNSPYLWVSIPNVSSSSWQLFHLFLEKMRLIVTPGVGFGSQGEGFIRISGFGDRKDILEACRRIGEAKF